MIFDHLERERKNTESLGAGRPDLRRTWCLLGLCTAAAMITLSNAGLCAASRSTRDKARGATRSWATVLLSFSRVTDGWKKKHDKRTGQRGEKKATKTQVSLVHACLQSSS